MAIIKEQGGDISLDLLRFLKITPMIRNSYIRKHVFKVFWKLIISGNSKKPMLDLIFSEEWLMQIWMFESGDVRPEYYDEYNGFREDFICTLIIEGMAKSNYIYKVLDIAIKCLGWKYNKDHCSPAQSLLTQLILVAGLRYYNSEIDTHIGHIGERFIEIKWNECSLVNEDLRLQCLHIISLFAAPASLSPLLVQI